MPGDSGKNRGSGGGGGANGFKALGLSESVYHGIVRMGFRVRFPLANVAMCPPFDSDFFLTCVSFSIPILPY